MTWNYWWPGVTKDVGRYVNDYDICQRIKNRTKVPAGKLKLSKILEAIDTFNSRLYYEVTIGSWKECNSSGLQ